MIERLRRALGGQIQMPTYTRTRWYLADIEDAEHNADSGNLRMCGQLMAYARRDGTLAGVLSTRTGGLVRLPRRFRGDNDVVRALDVGHDSVRSVFDEMFPPAELALLAADGLLCGVGVAELVPVKGRDYPVMVRLDPQYLQYVWNEATWYYLSSVGRLKITPGDGRWILHTPGGRIAPWQNGLWRCIARNAVRKEHANLHKDNWEAKLANPARVAVAPQGSTEAQKDSWFRAIMAWNLNSVFGMTPGYDVKLLESNGRGADSFAKTIADCNTEMVIAIAGQTVTTDGGAGFQNSDIHKTIRADLIKETADGLAYTVNTQGIPCFIALRFGPNAVLSKPCVMEWDVTPPKDRNSEAQSLVTAASAIKTLGEALATSDQVLDIADLCDQFAIPLIGDQVDDGAGAVPPLRLIQGGQPSDAAAAALAAGQAQDTALNGAQIASMLEVVSAVVNGLIPRDAALAIMQRAFLVDEAQANKLLGSAGAGFKPPAAAAPAAPAPITEAA
jgi:hypothetical protein